MVFVHQYDYDMVYPKTEESYKLEKEREEYPQPVHKHRSQEKDFIIKLDKVLAKLARLPDDWADHPKNKAFSERFLKDVRNSLKHLFLEIYSNDKDLEFPIIAPMEINSIDIHWKNERFQLLINIKESSEKSNVELYGRKMDLTDEIKWHGNLINLRRVISGWLLTKI